MFKFIASLPLQTAGHSLPLYGAKKSRLPLPLQPRSAGGRHQQRINAELSRGSRHTFHHGGEQGLGAVGDEEQGWGGVPENRLPGKGVETGVEQRRAPQRRLNEVRGWDTPAGHKQGDK